ncbi:MAG TPA: hypothetical protein VIX59_06390, partial [Candidatus Binataceae bacterium]
MILFKPPDFVSNDLAPGTRSSLRAHFLSFTKAALGRFENASDVSLHFLNANDPRTSGEFMNSEIGRISLVLRAGFLSSTRALL